MRFHGREKDTLEAIKITKILTDPLEETEHDVSLDYEPIEAQNLRKSYPRIAHFGHSL